MIRLLLIAAVLFPQFASAKILPPFARQSEEPSRDVQYYGGPVLSRVKVHIVYWGNGVSAGLKSQLNNFYSSIVDSTYMDQLAEYSTPSQKIGRGSLGETIVIQPKNRSHSLSQAAMEQELEWQVSSGALPKPDADSLYMIHFPDGYSIDISFGTSCQSWYADHEVYRSAKVGDIFYAMFPCGSAGTDAVSQLTEAASHELAEAITDPYAPLNGVTPAAPAAWLTPGADEIGDLCAWNAARLVTKSQNFTVQSEWLNSKHACNGGTFN